MGPAHYRVGVAVWDALRDPSPVALHALASGGTPEIPPMAGALHRHLQELPWVGDGLSLTQCLALRALRLGLRTISQMFSELQLPTEPLPFLGDTMFWAVLRGLETVGALRTDPGTAEERWPKQAMALTSAGEALLDGRADLLAMSSDEIWVRGVRIVPGQPCWRWDGDRHRPAWV
jgi:hypothetical protein